MDDAQYVFQQDVREKKITAHSANKKVRHTGCNLPSDYMTHKEKKAMNGEVKRMNIHKPMTYKFFRMLPEDLQTDHIQFMYDNFNATIPDIAKKWGITAHTLYVYTNRRKLNIKRPSGGRAFPPLKEQEWEVFWSGEPVENIQTAIVSLENARSETKEFVDDGVMTINEYRELLGLPRVTIDEIAAEQPFSMGSMNICLKDVRNWCSVINALSSFPLPLHNSVTITIHEVKEE